MNEDKAREAFEAFRKSHVNEVTGYPPTALDAWTAALQWQAEQQKGEALPKIASEVRIMLGSATELFDGIGDIVGYQIKTGALHRILGLLSGAGHPVAIAAKNKSVALASSSHGVPPQPSSIQQRAIDLHEKSAMPWTDAEELALNEAGIDARAIDELIGESGYMGLESLLTTADELRRFTRSVLVHQPAALQWAASQQAAEGWRPIETAPKDGTDVLVMYVYIDTQVVHNAFYASETEGWEAQDAGWWSYEHSEVSRIKLDDWMTPTHWMPLPAPPSTQGGADADQA